jgi:hypothetical protein
MIVELVVLSGIAVANDRHPEATQKAIRGVLVATGWSLKTGAKLIKGGLDALSRLGEASNR